MKYVAITSCSTGIAHTYMAAEALQIAAKEMNVEMKVETQGSIGAENVLTDKEYEVYTLRAKGFTYQEIASLLNTTTKSVDGALSRIKTKINNIKRID